MCVCVCVCVSIRRYSVSVCVYICVRVSIRRYSVSVCVCTYVCVCIYAAMVSVCVWMRCVCECWWGGGLGLFVCGCWCVAAYRGASVLSAPRLLNDNEMVF